MGASKSSSKRVGGGNDGNGIGGNGGIMGSGIFGMFGTTVHCDSKDDSYFCELSKVVNGLIMVIFLAIIVYLIYAFATGKFSSVKGGGKFGGGSGYNKLASFLI
jgi:hypothetical protein